jgi:hypothetical protein
MNQYSCSKGRKATTLEAFVGASQPIHNAFSHHPLLTRIATTVMKTVLIPVHSTSIERVRLVLNYVQHSV